VGEDRGPAHQGQERLRQDHPGAVRLVRHRALLYLLLPSFVSVAFLFSSGVSSQSPDGDVIDCVPTHLQPAFQHPKLRGHRPEVPAILSAAMNDAGDGEPENAQRVVYVCIYVQSEPAARPGVTDVDDGEEQAWTRSGESCPEGTVPVRRTTEADVLRASSARRFGKKKARRDSTAGGHEVGHLSPAPAHMETHMPQTVVLKAQCVVGVFCVRSTRWGTCRAARSTAPRPA
jgi:hypothetical protein